LGSDGCPDWVDPGAPEDICKALLEGASWWTRVALSG
jgi:hypothetical protein